VEQRKVRFSDTDLNSHMNNTRYIDFILDMHDSSFYKNKRINKILINYNKELKDGQIVNLFSSKTSPEYIKGEVDDTNVFDVELTFENR
jgi:acyl-ACP thioesterase